MLNLMIMILLFFLFIYFFNRQVILSPAYMYTIIWVPIVVLYFAKPFTTFTDLSSKTVLIVLLSLVFFYLGYFSVKYAFNWNYEYAPIKYNLLRMQKVVIAIFFLIVGSFFLTVLKLGPPPLISNFENRSQYYIGYLEIIFLSVSAFWFLAMYLILEKKNIKLNITMIVITLVIVILKGNKFPLIIFLLSTVFFLTYAKKISLKIIGLIALVVLLAFEGSSYIYSKNQETLQHLKNILLGNRLPSNLLFLTDGLTYYLNNLLNLNNYINGQHPLSLGVMSSSGVINFLHIESLFTNRLALMNFEWQNSLQFPWLTTGSYLKPFYMDFGIGGTTLIPFILGSTSSYLYKTVNLKDASIIKLYLFLLLWLEIVLSFFTNYLNDIETLMNVTIVIFTAAICKNNGVKNV